MDYLLTKKDNSTITLKSTIIIVSTIILFESTIILWSFLDSGEYENYSNQKDTIMRTRIIRKNFLGSYKLAYEMRVDGSFWVNPEKVERKKLKLFKD